MDNTWKRKKHKTTVAAAKEKRRIGRENVEEEKDKRTKIKKERNTETKTNLS